MLNKYGKRTFLAEKKYDDLITKTREASKEMFKLIKTYENTSASESNRVISSLYRELSRVSVPHLWVKEQRVLVAFIRLRRLHAELKEAPQLNHIKRILTCTPIINLHMNLPDNI